MEYNTEVWSPNLKEHIDKIENIQRHYTKSICQRCNIPFSSYSDRLYKLNLLSLQDRRKRFDLITLFKIINNLSDLNFSDYFYLESPSYTLRSNKSYVRTRQKFSSNIWHNSFFVRAPRYWNKLDQKFTAAKSLQNFKTLLNTLSYKDIIWTFYFSIFLCIFLTCLCYLPYFRYVSLAFDCLLLFIAFLCQ